MRTIELKDDKENEKPYRSKNKKTRQNVQKRKEETRERRNE